MNVSKAVTDGDEPSECFADADSGRLPVPLTTLKLNGFGYRWIRLRFVP